MLLAQSMSHLLHNLADDLEDVAKWTESLLAWAMLQWKTEVFSPRRDLFLKVLCGTRYRNLGTSEQ